MLQALQYTLQALQYKILFDGLRVNKAFQKKLII